MHSHSMETLDSSATETVVFPPQIHAASTNTTTTITDTVNFQPDRHVHRDDGNGLDLEAQDGTLERLVNKTNELSYEVPSEDKDVDDGQQPLGIVESCFPYLARRNHHHTAPGKGPFSQLGFCPGVRCYYPSVGYDEEATQYAAVSRGMYYCRKYIVLDVEVSVTKRHPPPPVVGGRREATSWSFLYLV